MFATFTISDYPAKQSLDDQALNNHIANKKVLYNKENNMMRLIPRLFLILSLMLTVLTAAVSICSAEVPLDKEKRSSIQEVDGYAYLSEDKTMSQIRMEAFSQAKRQALEMAQTYIKSKTRVEDAALTYDLIWSEAEGSVRVLEQKDYGIEENSRIHVWIRAEVSYEMVPKGKGDHPEEAPFDLNNGSGPLTVKVWTDEKIYTDGQEVVIYLQGNRDFSAVVVDEMSGGEIIQLLPNQHRTDNFFKAGVKYRIPGPQDRFTLKVGSPYGTDKIVVYASEARIDSMPTQPIGSGIGIFATNQKDLAAKTRGLRIEAGNSDQGKKGVEFYEAQWSFSTKER